MKKIKVRSRYIVTLLFLTIMIAGYSQISNTKLLFDIAHAGDSIEYIKVGRSKPTMGVTIIFDDLNCAGVNSPKLVIGENMEEDIGGTFPESFSTDLPNPIQLDSTAVSTVPATAGKLKFRMYDEIGDVWNFRVKFINWDSYYLVFILDDVGTCTTGKIWIVK